MSTIASSPMSSPVTVPAAGGWWGRLHRIENGAIALLLLTMSLLPIAEIVLRATLHIGIAGNAVLVQHLGLIVGMLGAAIAARENRLLTLFTYQETALGERYRSASRLFTAAVTLLASALMAWAAFRFVYMERAAGGALFYGIPRWLFELALPLGLAAVAIRSIVHSSGTVRYRLLAGALAVIGLAAFVLIGPSTYALALGILVLTAATILGVPAFVTLGGISLLLFWRVAQPLESISVSHYSLAVNPMLPSVPLFTLAGYLLAESKAPHRLVRVFSALFCSLRGGPAVVTVLACAFFTSFTGASGVTILALGGLLLPVLREAGYTEKDALGLVTGAGALGILLPPCLPLILYAIVAQIPIQRMFLAGLVPAFLLMAATAGWGMWCARKTSIEPRPFLWRETRQALWEAKWELLVPVIALVGMFGGFATPVEASALTALYCFFVEVFIRRELKLFADIPRVATECGLLVGGILLILGVALGFTNYMVDAEVPTAAVSWTTQVIHNPILFLLLLNLFLTIIGCLMDIYSGIVVQVPLLAPLAAAFGIPPVHLGVVFLANMEHGYLTPPVGLNLLLSSYRFRKSVPEVLRSVLPIIVVLTIAVLLITYVPWLTTALPNWAADWK